MKKRIDDWGGPWRLLFMFICWLLLKIANATGEVIISTDSTFCNFTQNTQIVECFLNNMKGRLTEKRWTNVKGYNIDGASSLTVQSQCDTDEKILRITNSRNIVSKRNEGSSFDNCFVGLYLSNSTASNLNDLFRLINIKNSTIETINLDVEQFDITEKSTVIELNITSNKALSTLTDSRVEVVSKMELVGTHKLDIANSFIGELKHLIYNSNFSQPRSQIIDTVVQSVSGEKGIEMIQGNLLLENVTFNYLASEAFIVYGGNLHLRNVHMASANEESLVLRGKSKVIFENVKIGEEVYLLFTVETAGSEDVWPLAIAFVDSSGLPTVVSIIIGIIVGFIIGVIVFGILNYFHCFACLFRQSEKKDKSQYPLTSVSTHPVNTEPSPPTPLIANNKKGKEEEENIYEDNLDDEYQDVEQPCISPTTTSLTPRTQPDASPQKPGVPFFPPVPTRPPPQGIPNQLQENPKNNFSSAQKAQTTDEEEPIYDECENVEAPSLTKSSHTKPIFQNPSFLKNFGTPMHNTPPGVLKKQGVGNGDRSIEQPNGQQKPLIPKPAGNKPSFLHMGQKPPPPPRGPKTMGPLRSNEPATSGPAVGQVSGQPLWPPQSPPSQPQFSSNAEDEEDIYEEVPDF